MMIIGLAVTTATVETTVSNFHRRILIKERYGKPIEIAEDSLVRARITSVQIHRGEGEEEEEETQLGSAITTATTVLIGIALQGRLNHYL